jgi:hypothetical protein
MASEKTSAEQTQDKKKENEKPVVNGVKKDEEEELVGPINLVVVSTWLTGVERGRSEFEE